MPDDFYLLGDPIPENWGKRGRPPYIPTEQNSNEIRLLLSLWWTNNRIVRALRITGTTLRKYYFRVRWRPMQSSVGGKSLWLP